MRRARPKGPHQAVCEGGTALQASHPCKAGLRWGGSGEARRAHLLEPVLTELQPRAAVKALNCYLLQALTGGGASTGSCCAWRAGAQPARTAGDPWWSLTTTTASRTTCARCFLPAQAARAGLLQAPAAASLVCCNFLCCAHQLFAGCPPTHEVALKWVWWPAVPWGPGLRARRLQKRRDQRRGHCRTEPARHPRIARPWSAPQPSLHALLWPRYLCLPCKLEAQLCT